MTICKRLRRERVSLSEIRGVDEPESWANVRACMEAMRRAPLAAPVFLMRVSGETHLIHGADQIAAAEAMQLRRINAVVFEPADVREENDVGAVGFDLAEQGMD